MANIPSGFSPVFVPGIKAEKAVTVTPSDSSQLETTAGVYLGTSGDLAVTMKNGSQVVFKSLAAGMIHPLSVTKVRATGTTATDIVVVY